jgi:hypothetical protein
MKTIGGRTVGDWLLLFKVAVASLVGGLLAVGTLWILKGSLVRLRIILLLVVLVAVLIVLALAALMSDGQASARPRPRTADPRRRPASLPVQPTRRAPVPDRRDAGAATVPGPLPTFAPPPRALEAVARPRTVEEYPVPGARPDASAVRRIVQCPRCGDFGIEPVRQPASFAFACRRCGHAWQWRPGRPWPATVVRPPGAERGLPPDPAIRRFP